MAAYEWSCYTPMVAAARPGIHLGGGSWTDIGVFSIASTLLPENTSGSFDYYPSDRIAFANTVGVNWSSNPAGEWGAWMYHQNEIRRNDGTDWPVALTLPLQQNIFDFGVHSGLYQVWGSDGKAYLCGLYPGTAANTVGAVRYDFETGVWDTWTESVGGKFSRCASAVAHYGKLMMATQGFLYTVDPANKKIGRQAGPVSSSDPRDKVFFLSDRFFWAGRVGGRFKVYEYLGTWIEVADLLSFPMAIGGEWALIQDHERVGFVFYSGLRTLGFPDPRDVYYAHFSFEANSSTPLDPPTVVDHTEANRFSINPLSVPIPLASAVVSAAHESDLAPLTRAIPYVMIAGGSAATSGVHPLNRARVAVEIEPVNGSWGAFGGGSIPGGLSYVTSRYGYQDAILNRDERIDPYRVEEGNPADPFGSLRIHYAGFTSRAVGEQMSVRIYYREKTLPGLTGRLGSAHPLKNGTITGFDAPNGAINIPQKRIDAVPLFITGADHYIVWDRLADLGADADLRVPFQALMNFAGSLPPLN